MREKEILKCLSICTNVVPTCLNCDYCKITDNVAECELYLLKDCKKVIDRYKAKIEKLQDENKILSKNADTAFQEGLNEVQELYAEQIKTEVKKEAYREFADELKKYAFTNASEDGEEVVEVEDIENVLKELGVDNNDV